MIEWYQKHKVLFFVIVGICAVLFSSMASAYNDVNRLNGVCVNEENGQIAVSYFTSDVSAAVLKVYDAEGEILFKEKFNCAGGGAFYTQYIDNSLYVYIPRTDMLFTYDEQFNETATELKTSPEFMNEDNWIGWRGSTHHKTYDGERYQLVYEDANLFESMFGHKKTSLVMIKKNGDRIRLF